MLNNFSIANTLYAIFSTGVGCTRTLNQGILKGEVSLYRWPPVWLVWNQLYDNWQFLFLFAKADWSKPVKQEVNGTVILPPLVFPASTLGWPGKCSTTVPPPQDTLVTVPPFVSLRKCFCSDATLMQIALDKMKFSLTAFVALTLNLVYIECFVQSL